MSVKGWFIREISDLIPSPDVLGTYYIIYREELQYVFEGKKCVGVVVPFCFSHPEDCEECDKRDTCVFYKKFVETGIIDKYEPKFLKTSCITYKYLPIECKYRIKNIVVELEEVD